MTTSHNRLLLRITAGLILIKVLLLFPLCSVGPATMDTGEARTEIYTAIIFKQEECKNRPTYPLFVFDDPEERAINNCTLAIINAPCPFNDYPLICLTIYSKPLSEIGGGDSSGSNDICLSCN